MVEILKSIGFFSAVVLVGILVAPWIGTLVAKYFDWVTKVTRK